MTTFSRKEDRTFRKKEEPIKWDLDELRKTHNEGSVEEQIREHRKRILSLHETAKKYYQAHPEEDVDRVYIDPEKEKEYLKRFKS